MVLEEPEKVAIVPEKAAIVHVAFSSTLKKCIGWKVPVFWAKVP